MRKEGRQKWGGEGDLQVGSVASMEGGEVERPKCMPLLNATAIEL